MMIYTQAMDQYIREIAPGRLCREIAEMFNEKFGTNVTEQMIKCYKSNHKIHSGISTIDFSKREFSNKLLNAEQAEYLKSIYLGISNRECTRMINEKFGLSLSCEQIKNLKHRLKLDSGLDGRFQKGNLPNRNCFKKGERNSIETEYKKGMKPLNWVPVGTERVRDDGYVYVKISDVRGAKYGHLINWKQKHVILWEQANGPVPKDSVLIFLDGDKMNVTLENLALVSKAEMLIMNKRKLVSSDPEVTKLGIATARLLAKGYKLSKKGAEKKMIEQLKELLQMQKKLDETMMKNAGLTEYPLEKVKIALFVELGELMNEMQTEFKFWKKTAKDNREKAVEEYVDCLHFQLSLFNYYKVSVNKVIDYNDDFSKEILKGGYALSQSMLCCVSYCCDFRGISWLFDIGNYLGFTWNEIYNAYKDKNKVNYERQNNGY